LFFIWRKCWVILDLQEILFLIPLLFAGKVSKFVWIGGIHILPKVISVCHAACISESDPNFHIEINPSIASEILSGADYAG